VRVPLLHAYEGELSDQLTVAWQRQEKFVHDEPRYRVVPKIPTDPLL
jgi:hypothetical protein